MCTDDALHMLFRTIGGRVRVRVRVRLKCEAVFLELALDDECD